MVPVYSNLTSETAALQGARGGSTAQMHVYQQQQDEPAPYKYKSPAAMVQQGQRGAWK